MWEIKRFAKSMFIQNTKLFTTALLKAELNRYLECIRIQTEKFHLKKKIGITLAWQEELPPKVLPKALKQVNVLK